MSYSTGKKTKALQNLQDASLELFFALVALLARVEEECDWSGWEDEVFDARAVIRKVTGEGT